MDNPTPSNPNDPFTWPVQGWPETASSPSTIQRMMQAKAPWAQSAGMPGVVAYKGAHPSQDQGFQVSAPNGDKVILSKDEYANYMKDKDNFWFDYDDGRHISR